MENKQVGYLLLGIAVLLIVIVFLFQSALQDIVVASCGEAHTTACPMNDTVTQQTYLSLSIVGILIIFGFVLIFTKPKEKIVIKKVKEKRKKIDKSKLDKDEKKVISILEQENGTIFQATLKENLEIGKVKLTRLLDKLEAKQFIERKRRGMNNIVVLKH
jgi:uncharacterized membrane protein